MPRRRFVHASAFVVLAWTAAAACSGSSSSGPGADAAPSNAFCTAAERWSRECAAPPPCTASVLNDCAKLEPLLAPALVTAAAACITAGNCGSGDPVACLASAAAGLTPSAADDQFASDYCGHCAAAPGPSCAQSFFATPDGATNATTTELKAGSDTVVQQVDRACLTTNTSNCEADLPSCVRTQLYAILSASTSAQTAECLVGGAPPPGMDGGVGEDSSMGGPDTGMGVPDSGSQDTGGPPDAGGGDGGSDGGCAVPCGASCCSAGQVCNMGACQNAQFCTVKTDCPSGCCAPAVDATGQPVGPYICKPNDANAYDCCYGIFNTCGGIYCCVQDSKQNEFCAAPCSTDGDCAPAHCDPYSFTFTTCSGPTACGP